jgi:hypothetical protein
MNRELLKVCEEGFIAADADKKLVVTDRGDAFAGSDPDAAKKAAREAIMATSFGLVINRLTRRKADPEVVAFRLQEDQGLDDSAAKDRAKLIVKAAKAAGLVSNGNFDGGVIEDTIAVVGEPSASKASEPAAPKPAPKPQPQAPATDKPAAAAEAAPKDTKSAGAGAGGGKAEGKPDAPFQQAPTAPLQVVLHIDARKVDAAEIGAIVRELRASVTASMSGS